MGKQTGKVRPQFYTWEQNHEDTGHTFVVGTLDDIGLSMGEPRYDEKDDPNPGYSECKWHKDLDAVETYLKSFNDYDSLVKDNRIAFNESVLKKNDASVYEAKGWVSLDKLNQESPNPPEKDYVNVHAARDEKAAELITDWDVSPTGDSPKYDASDDM